MAIGPVLVILVLLALGGGYEAIGHATATTVAMGGQLVDVGPYRLHLECTGSRGPTVVLEPGGGESAASLGLIAPAVARDSRVCLYDRAGCGWSDAAVSPPDGAQIATDLHTLLNRAHVPGPYVLAGHSFGGLYVRAYAAKYPDEVAGLVLVDSTASHHTPVSSPRAGSYSVLKHLSALVATTSRLGIGDGSSPPPASRTCRRGTATTHEPRPRPARRWRVHRRVRCRKPVRGRSRPAPQPRRKPLVVLTAERGNSEGWMADQNGSATLSTNSVHRVVPGATHAALVEDPKPAAAVSQAVHDVVTAVRAGAPLQRP